MFLSGQDKKIYRDIVRVAVDAAPFFDFLRCDDDAMFHHLLIK
jgi:hypothetical protein